MSEKRIITVLLTRYHSLFGEFVYYNSGKGYTHASIALDEDMEYFYSFNKLGFRKEYPKKHKFLDIKSVCYKLEVPEEDYQTIKERIEEMWELKDNYHYSQIGAFLCLLHIPFKMRNHYFCSEFVVELLQQCKSISLKKHCSRYLPNQLPAALAKQLCLKEVQYNPLLV